MKLSIHLLAFFTLVCLEAASQSADSSKYKSLEPYDFHLTYLKDEKAVLIDVREFFEYKKSRIKDAINIPSSVNMKIAADTLGKDRSLFLYCTTGYRSKRAADKFIQMGFEIVYSLDGGIKAWKQDEFPVEKKRLKRCENSH